jgi:hypothetical protein
MIKKGSSIDKNSRPVEDSSLTRGEERPRKIIGRTIKRHLEVNDLSLDLIYTTWHYGVHVADPT